MEETDTAGPPGHAPWTCPFCPLLCDGFGVRPGPQGAPLQLVGSDCPRAHAALAHFSATPAPARPQVDGQDCTLDTALQAAAALLAASRQPLFGGLGTDVAGARALYALACATGAVCDPAQGEAMVHSLRALQDRGGFGTTLAEVRTRADLVLCVTEAPQAHHPELLRRFGLPERTDLQVLALPLQGDLFETLALLAARLAGRLAAGDARVPPALAALAEGLAAARYAVLVVESARLPAHGALIHEAVGRIVATLNRSTRAAALTLGGGDGASTVNQVFTWLSGLPLRSRLGPLGLEHEPLCFGAQRLLDDAAVDLLLWVASYGPAPVPPRTGLATIVLGHPGLQASAGAAARVFIPVSTPGIGSAGHLFRTDGSVLLPLHAVVDDGLPRVDEVVRRLTQAVQAQRAGQLQ